MENSQLIRVLSIFSPKEIKELKKMVRSPFFNSNKNVEKLMNYLAKYYPSFPEKYIRKKTIHSKLFKDAAYNDGYLRKIMFTLNKLAEEYLSYLNFSSNKHAKPDALLQEYFKRNKPELFLEKFKENNSALKKHKQSTEKFYYSFLNSYRNLAFGAEQKILDFSKFAVKNDLMEPLEHLSSHYYSNFMNLYEYYINTQHILSFETDHRYFENIISSFDMNLINKNPLLKIHYNLIKMLTEPGNEEFFYITKEYVTDENINLGSNELENIYINLQNYCMRKIRANKNEFSYALFEIYKSELKRAGYTEERNISVILYRNVIFTALQLNEIIFAEEFAEKYRPLLHKQIADANYLYSKAHIALKKKQFSSIAGYISRIKSSDELLKADIKVIMLCTYIETGAVEQFHSLVDSFRHYLSSNNRLSDERKKLYETFISFCTKLNAITEEPGLRKLDELEMKINTSENVINKSWLIEKITIQRQRLAKNK